METTIITRNSNSGLPTVAESGGSWSNRGDCTVIANAYGDRKTAIYIPRGGHLCNATHAVFVAEIKDTIIDCSQWRGDYNINIYTITDINPEQEGFSKISLLLLANFSRGEWDKNPPEFLEEAIEAARKKARDYHCRSPYFFKEKKK